MNVQNGKDIVRTVSFPHRLCRRFWKKSAAFFMPKFRKEATPCTLLPAKTGPLNGWCRNSPVSITTTAAGRTCRRIAAVAASIARIGNINTACMQSVPISRASWPPLLRSNSQWKELTMIWQYSAWRRTKAIRWCPTTTCGTKPCPWKPRACCHKCCPCRRIGTTSYPP